MTADASPSDDMPAGSARSYEVPCVWIVSGDGHREVIPATLTTSRTDDGWWVYVTPDGWATLWFSTVEAQPWGPWRAFSRDRYFATARAAIDAAMATDQIGPAS